MKNLIKKNNINISSGWREIKLGDTFLNIRGGGTPSKEVPEYWGGKIPWATVKDISNFSSISTQDYITKKGLDSSSSYLVSAGTMIMPTRMLLGVSVFFDVDVAINQDLKAISFKGCFDKKFIYFWIIKNSLKISRLGIGSTVAGISQNDLKLIKLISPPLPEQKRIVAVLEIWDTYLEKLERKIVLKRNIKKGLMQQLLTGKKRLEGFCGEWQVVKLGDVGFVRTSSVDKKNKEGEDVIGLLNYMDVYRRDRILRNDTFQQVTANRQQMKSSSLIRGDILFTPSSETQNDIGHSAVVIETLNKVLFSYHLIRLRPKKNILCPEYSAYCFKGYVFYKELWKKSQGATRYTLSKEAIEKSRITIPKLIEEQSVIANILTKADEEIEALEQKKKIVEAQKKYLLNNLITGKIRTV